MAYINHLHSIIRWIIVFAMLFLLYKSYIGFTQKNRFTLQDNKLHLILISLIDIQLLIGLVQFIFGAWGIKNIQAQGMRAVMHDNVSRFFAVEHLVGMLVAITIVHIGRAKIKKISSDTLKYKKIFTTTLIAFIIILLSIPWPFIAAGVGRHWF